MPWLSALAGYSGECRRVFRAFLRESECLTSTGGARGRRAVHVEIAFYLAPFLLEKHRQQKTRTENLPEPGKQTGTRARPEGLRRMTVLRHEVTPDDDVPVLDVGKPGIDVLLSRV